MFGHPALSSEFSNFSHLAESCSYLCLLRKNIKSPFEGKFYKTNSSFTILAKLFFLVKKIKTLTWHVDIRTLDRVSELRAHYPMPHVIWLYACICVYVQCAYCVLYTESIKHVDMLGESGRMIDCWETERQTEQTDRQIKRQTDRQTDRKVKENIFRFV